MAKPGKKKKVLFVLEIIVLLLFIGGLYVYGQISSRLDKIEQPELKKEKIVVNQEAPKMTGYKTYVLFGIDTRGEGSQYSAQNSDTMIIVSVNNDTKEVRMVSVYRDTLLNVGDDTYTKANAAYALGGPEQAITMLNTNLDLDISDYATADFYNFTDVDGICSSLTRLEADRDETDFPVKIRSEGSHQCVRQIVVFRHQRQILGHVVCFHQTERGICIRHGYVEIGPEHRAQHFFHDSAGKAVAAACAVSENGVVALADLPELFELLRIGLTVGIGLEDIVRTVFKCIAVAVQNGGTVAAVWLRQHGEQRAGFALC